MRFRLVLLVLVGVLLAACDTAFHTQLEKTVNLYNRATVSMVPKFTTLSPSTRIVVSFSKEMAPRTMVLGGTLAEAAAAEWAVSSITGLADTTTLFVSPKTTWPVGSHQTLTVSATDRDGYVSETVSREFGVLDQDLFVATTGNDAWPGTVDQPIATVVAGLDRLAELNLNWTKEPITHLKVAGGEYTVSDAVIPSGFTVDGAWAADGTAQDPARPTIWRVTKGKSDTALGFDDTAPGTTLSDVNLLADHQTNLILFTCRNSAVTLSRLNIVVDGGSGVVTLASLGLCNLTLAHLTVEVKAPAVGAGFGDAGLTTLYLGPAASGSLRLSDSSITLRGTKQLSAMLIEGMPTTIERCRFTLADSATNGNQRNPGGFLQAINSELVVRNSVFDAQDSTVSCEELLHLHGSTASLQNNTFRYSSYGVALTDRVQASIDNNLFLSKNADGGSLRVHSNDATPLTLRNNYFSDTGKYALILYNDQEGDYGTGWYLDDLADLTTQLVARNTLTSGNAGAINDSQTYDGDGLSASAPTILKTGGLNLSSQFTDDVNGASRPQTGAWSIGAWTAP